MSGPYDDIIHRPRPVSKAHPPMPIANRAAQFLPFAALTGYDAAIRETARLTDRKIELGESEIYALDMKLDLLSERIDERPEVTVTYYQPDQKKQGGAYVTASGPLKKIDQYERVILLLSGQRIPIADMVDVECALFEGLI